MSQDRPDKLDRIEATLDRVAQQLDNQVVVNAELRQSTAELTQSMVGLTQSMVGLTQSVDDLRATTETLLEITNIHQQGIEILAREMRQQSTVILEIRTDVNQLQESQLTTNLAIDRISLILDHLVRRQSNGNG